MQVKRLRLKAAVLVVGAMMGLVGGEGRVAAQAINPKAHKVAFDKARESAEVVASVRCLAAVCTEATGEGKRRSVTLELALQVLAVEKGPVKKNEVVVVAHKVNLPSGPGPGMYGWVGAVRRFPFTPGVRGEVALRWDREGRRYAVLAGWVAEPNNNPRAIPTEVGKGFVAGDPAPPK